MTNDHLELTFTESKVTADFMVDSIEAYFLKQNFQNEVDTLVINADNRPENNSRRTQFMKRIIEFAAKYDVKVILACYPPYHSKYNPIERAWGIVGATLEWGYSGHTGGCIGICIKYDFEREKPLCNSCRESI